MRARATASAMVLWVIASGCAKGVDGDLSFGVSAAPGGEDAGADDAGATKGNPSTTVSDDSDGSSSDDGAGGSSSDGVVEPDDEESSTGFADSAGESSDEGWLEEEGGEEEVGEQEPPGEPMYDPCDPDAGECADGICLSVLNEYQELISTFCTGPCAWPEQDCDEPPDGSATPACVITNGGESVCSLDCSGGATCPLGMECVAVGGELMRCI